MCMSSSGHLWMHLAQQAFEELAELRSCQHLEAIEQKHWALPPEPSDLVWLPSHSSST